MVLSARDRDHVNRYTTHEGLDRSDFVRLFWFRERHFEEILMGFSGKWSEFAKFDLSTLPIIQTMKVMSPDMDITQRSKVFIGQAAMPYFSNDGGFVPHLRAVVLHPYMVT